MTLICLFFSTTFCLLLFFLFFFLVGVVPRLVKLSARVLIVMGLGSARLTVNDLSKPSAKANTLRKLYRYAYLIHPSNHFIRPSI